MGAEMWHTGLGAPALSFSEGGETPAIIFFEQIYYFFAVGLIEGYENGVHLVKYKSRE